MGYTPENLADCVVKNEVIQTVFTYEQAVALDRSAQKLGTRAEIHLKINTGMNRIGFEYNDLESIFRVLALKNIFIEGIFTHFAEGDSQIKI